MILVEAAFHTSLCAKDEQLVEVNNSISTCLALLDGDAASLPFSNSFAMTSVLTTSPIPFFVLTPNVKTLGKEYFKEESDKAGGSTF